MDSSGSMSIVVYSLHSAMLLSCAQSACSTRVPRVLWSDKKTPATCIGSGSQQELFPDNQFL